MQKYIAILLLLNIGTTITKAHAQTSCDSLLNIAIKARQNKDFSRATLVLDAAEKRCDETILIWNQRAINAIEKADNSYNFGEKITKKERFRIFEQGLEFARKAYSIDSTNKYALEYLSLAFAGMISQGNLSQQAHLADSVRIYAEKMLFYDPTNDRAYHILGRWHYEVANLSWLIRFFSKVIFGVVPDGDYNKSIYYFQNAVKLDDYAVHNYWLAQAYLKSGDKTKAVEIFTHILGLPKVQHNDDYFKDKAREILKSLR